MTSRYTGDGFENLCGAAINGNTATNYEPDNCVHSSIVSDNPIWTVDLGQEYLIVNITIFARKLGKSKRVQHLQVPTILLLLISDKLNFQTLMLS